MSTLKVDTIATRSGSGSITVSNDLANTGHASIGVSAVDASRALTVAGATDGSSGSGLVVYNSSLASKFSVRDDGLVSITNNATVGGTLTSTGLVTASAGVAIGGTGTANTLDDYEEGFYNPTYGASGGYGNQTYTSRVGVYTKIGNIVKVWVDMTLSANSSQAGIPIITLPFTSASTSNLGTDSTGSQRYEMGSWTPWAVDSAISSGLTTGWISVGSAHMTMYRWSGSYNYGHTNLPLNATGRIAGTIWYTAAF